MALRRIAKTPVLLRQTHKPSPFAFPIMVGRFREKLTSEKLADRVRRMQLEFDKAAPPEGVDHPGEAGAQLNLSDDRVHRRRASAWCCSPRRRCTGRREKTLFVADFHLGKAASFRSAGIPLPSGTTTENVERLDRAIDTTGAQAVVFLGDFLHSAEGRAHAHARALRRVARARTRRSSSRSCAATTTRTPATRREAWGVALHRGGRAPRPLHRSTTSPAQRAAATRSRATSIPPCASPARASSLRLPCFWFGARYGVLPAFGAFTGTAEVLPREATRCS